MSLFNIISVCMGGGYRYCRTEPKHPKANSMGLYPLHRVLMENKLGRLLERDEIVHHKDENKRNDDIDNLVLLTNSEHSRLHRPVTALVSTLCGCCKKKVWLKPHIMRQRVARSQRKRVFCSRACAMIKEHTSRGREMVSQPVS